MLRRLREPLYRQSAFLIAGAATSAATGFLFWLTAARLVSPAEVGRAAALVAAVAIVNYLTGLGLPQGLLRFSGHFRTSVSELVNAALVLTSVSSLLAAVVFAAGAPIWAPQLHGDLASAAEVGLFALFSIGVSVGLVLDSALTARRRGQWAFARSALMSVGKLAALPLLASAGAVGIYISMCAPIAAASAFIFVLLPVILPTFRRGAISASGPVREFLEFSLRTFPSNIFAGAPMLLPLIVSGLLGARQTAFFYVAWSFTAVLQLVPILISQVSLTEAAWRDPWRTAARAKRFALSIVSPAIAVALVGASLILSLYGSEYADNATFVFRVFALAVLPWCFISIDVSLLRARNRHLEVFLYSGAFAFFALLGAVTGALAHGLEGLAVGWLAGTGLVSLVVELHMRQSRISFEGSAPGAAPDPVLDSSEIDEHRLVFVGGLHRSGTTPLTRWLARHPDVSGFEQTGASEDEGQHLQSVYPPDPYYGGPGRFAFAPDVNLTEASSLNTQQNRLALWDSWREHWDLDKRVLIEKSPPNLLQTRFLQALFPGSVLILVIRHPIAVSEATHKWGHPLVRVAKPPGLIRHWLRAYETFLSDATELENVILVRYEDLIRAPEETLGQLFSFVGVEASGYASQVRPRDLNSDYFESWPGGLGQDRWPSRLMARWIVRRYERRAHIFGYSLGNPHLILDPDERVQRLMRGRRLPQSSRLQAK